MTFEVFDHPEAPSLEELDDYVIEPVAPDVIQDRRDQGYTLVEENLLDHPDVNAVVELTDPQDQRMTDIGAVLYRLVQIFGTPQFPEYMAGNDVSWRTDDVFKYLLRVRKGATEESMPDEADDQWLVTVFDWKVRLGVALAEWHEEPDADIEVDPAEAVPILAVITNGVTDPIQCVYEDRWF